MPPAVSSRHSPSGSWLALAARPSCPSCHQPLPFTASLLQPPRLAFKGGYHEPGQPPAAAARDTRCPWPPRLCHRLLHHCMAGALLVASAHAGHATPQQRVALCPKQVLLLLVVSSQRPWPGVADGRTACLLSGAAAADIPCCWCLLLLSAPAAGTGTYCWPLPLLLLLLLAPAPAACTWHLLLAPPPPPAPAAAAPHLHAVGVCFDELGQDFGLRELRVAKVHDLQGGRGGGGGGSHTRGRVGQAAAGAYRQRGTLLGGGCVG
jgi:hypothetical protein